MCDGDLHEKTKRVVVGGCKAGTRQGVGSVAGKTEKQPMLASASWWRRASSKEETKQLLASGVLEEKLKKCCGGDVKCDRDRREYL